ncbi:hypothetical protein T440DRAFT_196939 [Plenodomus tracheiphilus IPT5]|uniref:Uncharacterized protein n=1 Tax=Plenodomus tracheiphilus IPT5 TaxID=1408161 RepID=A0A6A7AWD7_9PLEO|nr:hypothetical protein T440DRAFT_196939 [Plenodomus tracheiphilus IPT5]
MGEDVGSGNDPGGQLYLAAAPCGSGLLLLWLRFVSIFHTSGRRSASKLVGWY